MPLRLPVFLQPPVLLLPCISSTMAHHAAHLEKVVNTDEKQIESSKIGDTSNGKQGAVIGRTARMRIADLNPVFRHLGYKSSQPRPNVIERISNKSNMLDEYKHARTSTSEPSVSSLEKPEEYPSSADVDREDKSSLPVVSSGGTLADKGGKNNSSGEESLKEKEYLDVVDYKHALEKHSLPTSFGKYEHPNSKKPKSIKHNLNDGGYRNEIPASKIGSHFEVFDICHSEADGKELMRYPLVFLDERKALAKEPEVERLCEEPRKILRPGMVIERISNKYNMLDEYKHARTSTSEPSVSSLEKPEEYPSSADVDREDKSSLPVVSSSGTLTDKGSKSNSTGEESLKEKEYLDVVDYKHALEEHSLPTRFGKYEHPNSKKPKSIKHNLKDGGYRNGNPTNKIGSHFEVFDICHSEADGKELMRYPLVFLDERKALEKEPEVERLCEEPRKILRPGMVLLKGYISDHEQVSIIRKCRKLGVGPGGFYRPGYKDGAKLRLYMMCLGLDWDPQTRKYNKRRRIDRSKPPNIPPEFHRFVDRAMQDSHALIRRDSTVSNAEDILPYMNPDVCIVNFYTETGRLGLHQDRDESRESLTKGLPVVSFSLGDSAEFLYGDARDINTAEKLILESGDVLIFGGQSRHVFHGVASIIPDSTPGFLPEETGLRRGRLNLTFRQNL